MAKIKVNDKGIARVSLYLNSKNPKDKKIIYVKLCVWRTWQWVF